MSTRRITRRARLAQAAVGAVVIAGLTWLPAPAYAAVSVDLWAVTGSTTLPGAAAPVTVWGYQTSNGAASAPGGPTLTVPQGEEVTITLHNELGGPQTGLLVQGQPMVPDLEGIGNTQSRQYTFTADRPGTFLYEAAPIPGAQYQPAMGLYGALVVTPASAGQAYDAVSTAYDTDQVLLLGEIDPALNGLANPASFDMRNFHAAYHTINGAVYPETADITATPGTTQLLRYVNAGMNHRSMAVLGADQAIIARDGAPLTDIAHVTAETMGPGQTMDALVDVPASQSVATELFVYDASNSLHNSNTSGVGGVLTSIPVAAGATQDVGPVTSGASFLAGELTASADDGNGHGGGSIAAAEYYLDDAVGNLGSGTAMTVTSTGPATADAVASVALPADPPFEHTVYVRAQDSAGLWGPLTSVLVNADDTGGPTVVSPLLKPNLVGGDGTQAVKVSATADDTSSGNSTIQAAEYSFNGDGSDPQAMVVSPGGAGIASIDATIDGPAASALSEGAHPVYIRAQDSEGNWGAFVSVQLSVDKTGPATSGIVVDPTPNNGHQPFNSSVPAVRVSVAQMSDPATNGISSQIAAGEMFIDGTPATDPGKTVGKGIPLIPSNGVFVDTQESGYADIPLATVRQMTEGTHTVYVHAKDAAGNWGDFGTADLVVDKTGPTVQALSVAVAGGAAQIQATGSGPTNGATEVTLTGTASDDSSITAAQWWWDNAKASRTAMQVTEAGGGSFDLAATVPVTGLGDGRHQLRVRVRDGAGNWGTKRATVQVSWPLAFSTQGNAAPGGIAGAADNSDGYQWSGSAYTRATDLTEAPYRVPARANIDGLSLVDASHFYVSFDRNTRLPGLGQLQDEDVAQWNDGTWEVFFDGTSHGLRSKKADLDAVSVVGDTLFFSTQGNVKPRRVKGRADDADIYRWNGTRFSRVWDASRHGIPGRANVDGYDRDDGKIFYLSFAATHRIRGLGKVQDEDVITWNGGSRTVYFNGTAHGMAGSGHDVDGLDVP